MNCCINCFNDPEVTGFIRSNSTATGACDFCGSTGVQLVNTVELEELFQPIALCFKTCATLGIPDSGRLMHQKIQDTWKMFRNPDEAVNKNLLGEIINHIIPAGDPLLESSVEIAVLTAPGLAGDVHEQKWENFATEIKSKNRFFLNETIDLPLLANLLEYFSRTYDPGKVFYRGRVSERGGIALALMGKPPADKTTSGRANPNGIPYLYLAADVETTVYESRSTYLDFLTVAQFRLRENMKVVSLRGIDKISPVVFSDQLEKYLSHQKYLIRLERELSKPVRRYDKELDYLPSQYLCEYVKSLGYDAIEYGSSLRNGGINLAVFNDGILEPRSVEVYEITDFNLGFNPIAP